MTWMDPHPDAAAEFSNAFYDALDAEQAEADALADRLADHAPSTFTAALSSDGEASRPPIPAGTTTAPPAARPIAPAAPRDRRTPSERAA